jgi:hypothetical protein
VAAFAPAHTQTARRIQRRSNFDCVTTRRETKPLLDRPPRQIVVHGGTTPLEWLKVAIDPAVNAGAGPNTFGPFAWTRMIQPSSQARSSLDRRWTSPPRARGPGPPRRTRRCHPGVTR